MLFLVHMTVRLPLEMSEKRATQLKDQERSRALELQREGTWVHLWRVAGRYENYSVFEVLDADELHEILFGLPLFPYLVLDVTALCRHPSALSSSPDGC